MIITQKDIEKIIREVAGVQKTKIEVEVPGVIRVITQEEIEERKKQEIKEIFTVRYGGGMADGAGKGNI